MKFVRVQDIVSDMRKVISKHPQVEQKRLHRRAFFDNVDPENQALLVSSPFFKILESTFRSGVLSTVMSPLTAFGV